GYRVGRVGHRGAATLAAHDAFDADHAHEALDRAAGDLDALAAELLVDLASAVDLVVGHVHAQDLALEPLVALGAGGGLPPRRRVVRRRGEAQNLADRLNSTEL